MSSTYFMQVIPQYRVEALFRGDEEELISIDLLVNESEIDTLFQILRRNGLISFNIGPDDRFQQHTS